MNFENQERLASIIGYTIVFVFLFYNLFFFEKHPKPPKCNQCGHTFQAFFTHDCSLIDRQLFAISPFFAHMFGGMGVESLLIYLKSSKHRPKYPACDSCGKVIMPVYIHRCKSEDRRNSSNTTKEEEDSETVHKTKCFENQLQPYVVEEKLISKVVNKN